MKKMILAGVAALAMTACTTQERNVGTGAAIGAGTGAAIGAVATGNAEGALVGAALGGVGGALVGAAVSERPGYCYAVDRRGNRIYDRYGDPVVVEC